MLMNVTFKHNKCFCHCLLHAVDLLYVVVLFWSCHHIMAGISAWYLYLCQTI